MGTVHANLVTSGRHQSNEHWPDLPAAWADTYATLHMWTQIVGKIALAQSHRSTIAGPLHCSSHRVA